MGGRKHKSAQGEGKFRKKDIAENCYKKIYLNKTKSSFDRYTRN